MLYQIYYTYIFLCQLKKSDEWAQINRAIPKRYEQASEDNVKENLELQIQSYGAKLSEEECSDIIASLKLVYSPDHIQTNYPELIRRKN